MNVKEMNSEMFKSNVMDYTKGNDWKFKGERPAVIDFYATWCGPCRATAPVFAELSDKYAGKVDFYKVDVDKNGELAAVFGISSIPTMLFIPMTGNPKGNVGAMSRSMLDEAIKKHLAV